MRSGGGDLAAQRLGGAFGALGSDLHAGQFRQQLAGLAEADPRCRRPRHACHGRGQARAGQAQRRVAREEAPAAVPAVVVGALQGQRPDSGLEGLRVASRVARQLAAGAGRDRARVIGEVGIEVPLDGAGRQLQRLASQVGLERLEVELVRRPGSYEPGDLGFDRGGEFLLAGFFLAALLPSRRRDWHKSSLTRISSATRRRRRRHSAIWALVAST